MRVWVIQPGHGSTWLADAHYEGQWVVGWTWDDSGVGSALMPDDFRGERVQLAFPKRYILRVTEPEVIPAALAEVIGQQITKESPYRG